MTDRENEILKAWHANGIVYEVQPYKEIFAFAQAIERQALERAAERCMSILGYPPREYYAKAIRELIEQSASTEKQHG